MFSRKLLCAVLPALLLLGCTGESVSTSASSTAAMPPAPTANEVLNDVVAAMGTENLESIAFTGRAWRARNGWMQTPTANPPWPYRDEITNYQRAIDLRLPASRATGDTFAQDLFFNPATAGSYTQDIPATQQSWAQQLEIWLTPWGFLSGAVANGVELGSGRLDGVDYRVLTWMSPASQTSPSGMRYTVNGFINDDNLVAGVETWVEDAFMGDFHILQVFRDYRDVDGVMVPQTIDQQRGGGGIFGVIVTDADANPANLSELITPPQTAAGGPGRGGGPGRAGGPGAGQPDPLDRVEDLGNGAYLITGGYVALAVEFEDHVMVFEAGLPGSRGQEIIDSATAAIPDKPIEFLINSHPHSDHTGSIVAFMELGATLITHANNAEFLEMALNTPRTLLGEPDLNAMVEGVDGVTVYEDSLNRLELHSVPNGHTDGMLVAVLPRQGVLFQADFTLPQAGAEANPFVQTLAQYVADNNVQFERYLAVHAAQEPQTRADLLATIGR